jgi:hypothetical protein
MRIPCFSDVSSNDTPRPSAFGSGNTFGDDNYTRGPAYRLEDMYISDADSQEIIMTSRLTHVRKPTELKITCSPAESRTYRAWDRETW